MTMCPTCTTWVEPDDVFCEHCGNPLGSAPVPAGPPGSGPRLATVAGPVVMTLVPFAATTKQLAYSLCESIGVTRTSNWTSQIATGLACDALRNAGTQLLILDEAQNAVATKTHATKAAAQLKEITKRTTCTVVLAGIDLASTAFMKGTVGEQFLNRFGVIKARSTCRSPVPHSSSGSTCWLRFPPLAGHLE